MKKNLAVLSMVGIVTILTGCGGSGGSGTSQADLDAAFNQGYAAGYAQGDTDGYARAQLYFASADYNNGFADGRVQGQSEGYTTGYNVGYGTGRSDGITVGYNSGYNDGYTDGDANGYTDGVTDGYNTGYNDGFDDGSNPAALTAAYNNGYNDGSSDGYSLGYNDGDYDGYSAGYSDGESDGYSNGYYDGYDDGYYDGSFGFSVGPTRTDFKSGKVNLLSKVHNALIDYSKIVIPKETKRGLVAGGKLIFEETSMTSKDLEKKAAVAEGFIDGQVGKQIESKFGLSAERAYQVAKIANHFAKFSSKDAISDADSNAYSQALIGVDLNAVGAAYKASLSGDLSPYNSLVEAAAQANQTSSENVTTMIQEMFL